MAPVPLGPIDSASVGDDDDDNDEASSGVDGVRVLISSTFKETLELLFDGDDESDDTVTFIGADSFPSLSALLDSIDIDDSVLILIFS